MRKSRKNRFDWYSVSQRFSIRKYHIGAVSVLLGSCLLLNGIQAAAETQVAENTQPQVELVTEASPGGAVKATRQVTFTYKVVFVDSNGLTIKEDTLTHSISTTEEKATYSHTLSNLLLPEGYSLASNQDNKLTVTLLEGEVPTVYLNLDVLQVVEEEVVEETPVAPPAEEAGTKEEQVTEKVEEPTLETAEEVKPEEKVVAEVPQAPASKTVRAAVVPTEPTNPVAQPIVPTSVEEAKHVLEQVTSEAEVLSSQAERLVATSDQENEALKTVAAATKLTATEATVTLNDSKATLEIVNAKIDAVRTNVEALVLELRKFLGTDVIEIALATTTNMNDGIGRPGYWTEEEEVLNKSEAVTTATTKAQEQRIPAGYEVDPTPGRVTFLIYSLSNFDKDPELPPGSDRGSFNLRFGKDYYITLSLDRVKTTGNIYARLVSQKDGFIQEIEIPENTARHQFNAVKNEPGNANFTFRMSYTTNPFTTPSGEQSYIGEVNINSDVGSDGKGHVMYSLMTDDRTSYNSYTGPAPTYLPQQVTGYYVKETALRPEALLASYSHTAAISGDTFTIASPAEFANYELIESPTLTSSPVAPNYAKGTPLIRFFPNRLTSKVQYITQENGTSRFLNFVLNPDHPDFLANYAKYRAMGSSVDFQANGAEDLDLTTRIATIEKYLTQIEAVKADTSLTSNEQTNRLNELRTNYASEINTDTNKFLLMFVSDETSPLTPNQGADAVTGSESWSYEVKNYYTDGAKKTTISGKLYPYYNNQYIDWGPGEQKAVSIHYKDAAGTNRVKVDVPYAEGTRNESIDMFSSFLAMFNIATLNQNTQDYYYAEKGGVKVYYVDTTGTELKDPQFVFEHADTNTAYDTKSKLVDKIEKVGTDGTTTVYYYKEVDVADLKPVSQNTDTEKRSIVKITDEVGIVERDTLKELTYVYELAGSVNVNYVDIDGNKLSGTDGAGKVVAEKVADTVNAKAGTEYDTIVDNRPAKIVTADGKTYELAPAAEYTVGTVEADHHLSVSNVTEVTGVHEATGSVASGITKEITFVYKEVTGDVIVYYKDIQGNLISGVTNKGTASQGTTESKVYDSQNASTTNTGTGYNTTDLKPTTITTADGKTYRIVEHLTKGEEEGDIKTTPTEVTYYYEPVIGDVIIKYTDTEGNTLKDTVIDEDDVQAGTKYDTTDEGDKPTEIVRNGDKYVLVPSKTTAVDPTGKSVEETGSVVEGTTTITYVYQKVANWIPLIPNVPENKRPKTEYPFDPTEPDKEIPSIPTNPITDKPVIPHVPGYTPVDPKDNTPLKPVDPNDPGKGYVPPTPETPGEDTLIPYVPVKGDVVIKYVDTDGNTLKDSVIDEDDVLAGTKYDTTDEGDKPTEIVRNGDKYVLVPSKTTAVDPTGKSVEETGSVVEGTTTITYVYQKVANWIPLIPNVPENERPKTEYPFDPTEPDKEIPSIPTNPTTDKPVIPHVPGYTPVDPKDNTPLKPVDPEDPSKGYVPPTPETPGEDTLIPYVPVKGDVIIKYVDTDGNTLKDSVTDEDDVIVGTDYDTTDEGDKPTEIVRNGDKYVLVPSKTTAVDPADKPVKETGNVVEGTTTITYVYQKVANWIPLIPNVPENERPKTEYPFDPTTPDKEIPSIPTNPTTDKPVIPHVPGYTPVDPKDNTPLKPVDPNDPGKGYVPPTPETPGKDTLIPYVPVKGDVVINYVDTDGNILKSPVTDEDDVLAGTKYDTTDEGDKPTEIVRNGDKYVLVPSKTTAVDPTGKSVEETGSVVEGTTTITYVYQKVANWIPLIPNVPENKRPKTEYPFDPTEPDKEIPSIPTNPTTDKPVIPHVPGYTPVDPKDNTPLTPVDPEDPSKGYVPPTPETPGEDTLIPYVPVKGDVVIKYVDTDGNTLKDSVTDEDDVLAGTKYDTTDEGDKPTEIVRNGDKYVLVPSKTTAVDPTGKSVEETGSVVEGTTTITYVYQKVANWIPLIPNVPENKRPKTEYPFDPTEPDKEIPSIPTNPTTDQPVIPHVPGYTPVDPKDNTPLTPVDPEDPSKGYVPPTPETPGEDTLIPYVPVKGDVVIKYVDTDGNTLKDSVTDEDDVLAGTKYDTTDEGDKPTEIVRNGDKYVLVPSKTTAVDPAGKSVEETGSVVEGTTTITYVYQKVANWIPLIPNVPENERPKTEYPFDPTEPDKEIPSIPTNPTTDKPVIPHVPGYTPVDPKDNTPLTPVDPEDPSKGYVPPTPETPGEDTLIPYVPVKGDVVINYVDTDGNILKSPVTDEDDVLAGTKYNTTDEGDKPTEIVRNGDKYVLVPSKTTAVDPTGKSVEETGSVVEGTTTITYVYQKVANWIPLIPNVPENKRPKTEYPFDPTEPDKEIPSIPTNPTTDKPVIPHVPGYTPVDPKDNTPLTPVDPEDPSKGYVPPTPETPGEDTLIPYVPVKGDVVIKYVDTDGNTLKDSVTDEDDVLAGTKYDTTDEGDKPTEIVRNGDKYVLVPSKTTAVDPTGKSVEETGSVVEGTTTITYVYQKVANWIPLIPNVPENERPKTEYPFDPTEPDKEIPSIPTNPTTDKPVIPHVPGYTPVDPKDNTPLKPVDPNDPGKGYVPPTPETPGEDTLIPYVPIKNGTVIVTYITEDGKEIKSPVTDTPTSPEGTPYDTTDNKPKTITYNGEEYELVRVDGTENGTVVEGDTKVTYVYRKKPTTPPVTPEVKQGTVVVTYITEDGVEIKSPVTDTPTSPEGTPYDTTDNKPNTITYNGEEYELVRVDGTENGTVVEGDTKVTYVYRKKPTTPPVTPEVKQGSVIVAYITEDGVEIKSPVTDTPTSPEGTPYDTTDNKPNTITYNGEEYELVRVDGTENGTVVEGDTKVTYVYRKKPTTPPVTPEVKQGSVIVAYITEDGVEIKSPVTDTPTSPEGTPYDTTDNKPKTITYNGEEYELVRVDGTENGTVVEGDTKVTYVYRKKPATPPVTPEVKQGSVIVTYITEDGVEIKSPVTDTPTSPEGTPYDTTDNKPKTITYNGEEYELVRVEGTENGTVVEGDTKVTYVYRKVVKPTPPAPAKPSVAKPVKSEKPKLPDTGEEESTAGMLGVLLLVSSLFGVRKRRRDQQ